jgi:hypothetical protein
LLREGDAGGEVAWRQGEQRQGESDGRNCNQGAFSRNQHIPPVDGALPKKPGPKSQDI